MGGDYCRSAKSKPSSSRPSSSRSPTKKGSASSQMMSDSKKYKSAEFVVDSDDDASGRVGSDEGTPPPEKGAGTELCRVVSTVIALHNITSL